MNAVEDIDSLRTTFARPHSGFQTSPVELIIGKGSLLLLGSETSDSPCMLTPNRIINICIKSCDIDFLNSGPSQFFNLYPSAYTTFTFQQKLKYDLTDVLHFTRAAVIGHDDRSLWRHCSVCRMSNVP